MMLCANAVLSKQKAAAFGVIKCDVSVLVVLFV